MTFVQKILEFNVDEILCALKLRVDMLVKLSPVV